MGRDHNRNPARRRLRAALVLVLVAASPARAEDDGPLTIADLAAYRRALIPPEGAHRAAPATFRDLWERPDEYRGQRVSVSGRLMTVFHRGPVGDFPAMAEAWIFTPASDPLCLVFPETDPARSPKPGDAVRFEGTFLRRVRYRGGDGDRIAPLIVGPIAPAVDPAAPPPRAAGEGGPFDGVFVLVIGGFVALTLLRIHLRRPTPPLVIDRPPAFVDGAAAGPLDDDSSPPVEDRPR